MSNAPIIYIIYWSKLLMLTITILHYSYCIRIPIKVFADTYYISMYSAQIFADVMAVYNYGIVFKEEYNDGKKHSS